MTKLHHDSQGSYRVPYRYTNNNPDRGWSDGYKEGYADGISSRMSHLTSDLDVDPSSYAEITSDLSISNSLSEMQDKIISDYYNSVLSGQFSFGSEQHLEAEKAKEQFFIEQVKGFKDKIAELESELVKYKPQEKSLLSSLASGFEKRATERKLKYADYCMEMVSNGIMPVSFGEFSLSLYKNR